jgi:hypothetical protein
VASQDNETRPIPYSGFQYGIPCHFPAFVYFVVTFTAAARLKMTTKYTKKERHQIYDVVASSRGVQIQDVSITNFNRHPRTDFGRGSRVLFRMIRAGAIHWDGRSWTI